MSTDAEFEHARPAVVNVPPELVMAAIRAAGEAGRDVADLPLGAIAVAAGLSRSTLVRRLHGSRKALDDAVRAAGVDPGGRPLVKVRAVEAGAQLLGQRGIAAVTLEAVAEAAQCSVPALYAVFGGRDELLAAIYERYSPLSELEHLTADPSAELAEVVLNIYRAMAASFVRPPRVLPAMLADLLARSDGPAAKVFARYFPRALASVGGWLTAQVRAGRIRDLPAELLMQQLTGPLVVHVLFQPHWQPADIDQVCTTFTESFLRAVALPDTTSKGA